MKENFRKCMDHVFQWEGGTVDHPDDPGGLTKYGISQRSYPNVNIRSLTKAQAEAIYRRDYWNPVRGDDLPSGLDLVAYDAAVNSGVMRGAKWVQQAVGAGADGRIGPETIRRAQMADITETIDRAVTNREKFLRRLRTFPKFGRGWLRRTASTRALAHELAAQMPEPQKSGPLAFILGVLKFVVGLLRR